MKSKPEGRLQKVDSRSLLGLKVESCPTQQTGRHVGDRPDHAESCIPHTRADRPGNNNKDGQERQDRWKYREKKRHKNILRHC